MWPKVNVNSYCIISLFSSLNDEPVILRYICNYLSFASFHFKCVFKNWHLAYIHLPCLSANQHCPVKEKRQKQQRKREAFGLLNQVLLSSWKQNIWSQLCFFWAWSHLTVFLFADKVGKRKLACKDYQFLVFSCSARYINTEVWGTTTCGRLSKQDGQVIWYVCNVCCLEPYCPIPFYSIGSSSEIVWQRTGRWYQGEMFAQLAQILADWWLPV